MVISVSPLAPPAAPKCADVTELMGLKKVTYCSPAVSSPSDASPKRKQKHRRMPSLTNTHAHLHVLHPSHLCMHWADNYCGSFSPWQSTVKNWGVIIALGGGETRMAKYAWLPPKLRRCVMKYGCCRQGLPCDSFLVTFSLAFFFFFTPSLFCSGISVFAHPLPLLQNGVHQSICCHWTLILAIM